MSYEFGRNHGETCTVNCVSDSLQAARTLCPTSLEEIMEKHALLTALPCVYSF